MSRRYSHKTRIATAGFCLLLTSCSFAQSSRLITFEQLSIEQVQVNLSWTNPDSSREQMEITQMQIPVTAEIKELTRTYMRDNYRRSSIWIKPRMIVFHSMDLGNLKTSLEKSSFLDRQMPRSWKTQVKAGLLPSGAHFIIDRDGKIYCLTPPAAINEESSDDPGISYSRNSHQWFVRRHLDGNPVALGIENVTRKDGSYDDLTHEQVIANAQLTRWLLWMERGSVTHAVSHHQFNEREQFVAMLNEFKLELARPLYRAWTRKDVGDAVLNEILNEVRNRGWVVKERF